jgi:hypothetical protein
MASAYRRRFIRPLTNPVDGSSAEAEYDVVTEIWFEDQTALNRGLAALSHTEVAAALRDDTELFADRSTIRTCLVHHEGVSFGGMPGRE